MNVVYVEELECCARVHLIPPAARLVRHRIGTWAAVGDQQGLVGVTGVNIALPHHSQQRLILRIAVVLQPYPWLAAPPHGGLVAWVHPGEGRDTSLAAEASHRLEHRVTGTKG